MLLDSDRNRIRHMLEAAAEALEYVRNRTRTNLENDRPLQHLLVRDIVILGEAASRVSPELRAAHPENPWRDMVDMRNRLIHAYFDINLDIIWSTVQNGLPELLPQLERLQEREGAD